MRTTGIKQNLQLDKITGLRADRNNKILLKVKPEIKLKESQKSKRSLDRITKDGYKF